MGISDLTGAANRLAEEAFYAEALREIESGQRRDGIWAIAMTECEMDQARASAKYIKLRVQSLKDEIALSLSAATAQKEQEAEAATPRHPGCGGAITRNEIGNRITWRCAKCKATGEFQRGVSYGESKK